MKEAAVRISGLSPRILVLDRKRKLELASKLQQRWQRWEISNFDYLMQVGPPTGPIGRHTRYTLPHKNSFYEGSCMGTLFSIWCSGIWWC
jgi:hypothetical protein